MNSKLSKNIQLIDRTSMVLSILMLTGGYDFLKILAVVVYPTSLLFLFLYWKKTIWTIVQEKFLWIYIGIIIVSFTWSADVGNSIYSILKLLGTLLIGISFAVRYHPKEQLKILGWAFGIAILLSFFYGLVLPDRGIMSGTGHLDGAWRGIYIQKNVLGRTMIMSATVFLLLSMESSQYRWLYCSFLILSFALIILSTSKGALVTMLTLFILFPLYRSLRWSYSWIIPFFSIVILSASSCIILLVSQLNIIFAVLGRDATLTGRTPLWGKVLAKIWERPWLGYGYGGFWTGWDGESADIWLTETWEPPHAHNGILDVWLALGLIGLVISAITFFSIFIRSIACLRSTKSPYGLWPLCYLTLLFLANVTESNMNPFSVYWGLSATLALSTHRKIMNSL